MENNEFDKEVRKEINNLMKDYTMSMVIQECNSIVFIKGYMLFIN